MLNEKPSNGSNWKNRLEELDSVPGESIQVKHESWDILHQRLHGNNNRQKVLWYWVAAVGLILLFLLPLKNNTKTPSVVKINSGANKNNSHDIKSPSSLTDTNEQMITGIEEKAVIQKKKSKKISHSNHSFTIIDSSSHATNLNVTVSPDKKETELIIATAMPFDTGTTHASPVFAKKKLRVVHINELGQPVEENYKDNRYVDHQSLYRRLTNQNVFYSSPANAPTFSNDHLQIKLTPQN